MDWVGEFACSTVAAFVQTTARLKHKELAQSRSNDYCPDEAKIFIGKTLDECQPASEHLSWLGRRLTEYNLSRNDYFACLLGIDANTKPTKRAICIEALKVAASCICAGYNEEGIRAVTYSYLALRHAGLD